MIRYAHAQQKVHDGRRCGFRLLGWLVYIKTKKILTIWNKKCCLAPGKVKPMSAKSAGFIPS